MSKPSKQELYENFEEIKKIKGMLLIDLSAKLRSNKNNIDNKLIYKQNHHHHNIKHW